MDISWLADAKAWASLSFFVFLLGFFRYAVPPIVKALDARTESISHELQEAVRLKEAAQALLADYKLKQKQMEDEAAQMLAQAKQDAQTLRQQAEAQLQETIARRTQQAEQQISRAQATALADIQALMVNGALDGAQMLLAAELKGDQHQRLLDTAIADIKSKIH
jgi:F-type H+-transporting ATPase subunit b